MGRLRRVIPYLLFPSDPASAVMHCAPAGHAPRSVSAPMISQSRCCWGTAVSEITGIAHRSGGRVGDGFALFPPVFPRSSALSGYTQFLRWSGWRRKLSLRREFSPALLAAPATLPLRRSSGCARRWIRWEIKTGDPLSSFPSDPASAAMHCAPAGHAPRSVSAPMNLALPLLLRHRGEWDHGDRT